MVIGQSGLNGVLVLPRAATEPKAEFASAQIQLHNMAAITVPEMTLRQRSAL